MASASSDVGHLSKWRNVLLIMGIGGSKRQKHWRFRDSDCFICEVLITLVFPDYFVWGLIYSVQAPFYPDEALKRGADLSQVCF